METIKINTSELKNVIPTLKAGDSILLSGRVYTARDAAHAKLLELIKKNEELPFELSGAAIYYAGPTEAPANRPIGSCGPTTSGRMDSFSPTLLDLGLTCMIGKGNRNEQVVNSIVKNKAIYLCAIGGAGALAAKCITECEVIAFPELGCESIKRLEFKDFPLIVGIDSMGNSVFAE
ncbi:MAG: FumA C-terminus/TtdB family hydratase beta subunit [Acutalibacteraceae bacterium]|nr:FumA C-terminus/TtdB family hydratase beta subunit [Acutalibacteraceae bacterium]